MAATYSGFGLSQLRLTFASCSAFSMYCWMRPTNSLALLVPVQSQRPCAYDRLVKKILFVVVGNDAAVGQVRLCGCG